MYCCLCLCLVLAIWSYDHKTEQIRYYYYIKVRAPQVQFVLGLHHTLNRTVSDIFITLSSTLYYAVSITHKEHTKNMVRR